ncbi:hypothetical protein Lalb_Chr10g0092281 [Lupinus albus]|uniref:Uncharacterized protein n=1 Tax=Lupinus albus TaxID=3870 RepID=A0A6A4PUA1_LUPAL|nr:hypothetical protein Lalb_Chr10g0092281 [Lupinus albus]
MGKYLVVMSFFILFLVLASGLKIESENREGDSAVDNKACKSDQECGGCPPCEVDCLKPCCLCLRGRCKCSNGRGIHKLISIQ